MFTVHRHTPAVWLVGEWMGEREWGGKGGRGEGGRSEERSVGGRRRVGRLGKLQSNCHSFSEQHLRLLCARRRVV